jgi:hypothetical protein
MFNLRGYSHQEIMLEHMAWTRACWILGQLPASILADAGCHNFSISFNDRV